MIDKSSKKDAESSSVDKEVLLEWLS